MPGVASAGAPYREGERWGFEVYRRPEGALLCRSDPVWDTEAQARERMEFWRAEFARTVPDGVTAREALDEP